jgi:hypothetical protein
MARHREFMATDRPEPPTTDATGPDARLLLRHTLATLAYRGAKVLRDAPPGFGGLRIGETTRTPVAILSHIGDLLDWALSMARGAEVWREAHSTSWDEQVARFFAGLAAFDALLRSGAPLGTTVERLFQGPIADALTHVGQLAMLRRLAGSPVRGENYARADIAAGQLGAEQAAPRREFA